MQILRRLAFTVFAGTDQMSTATLSRNGTHPIALSDLTAPQMVEAINGLDRLEKEYENMSGICATLKGLVLIEAKARPELRGKFMEWVKKNFPTGHRTATRYMRLAEAFMGKLDSTVQFQTLASDLASSVNRLKQFQLDLSHPVVSKVAQWVNGRGAYQLMLDFPGARGGHHPRKRAAADYDPNAPAEVAHDLVFLPLQKVFLHAWDKNWLHLRRADLEELDGLLLDARRQLGTALKKSKSK